MIPLGLALLDEFVYYWEAGNILKFTAFMRMHAKLESTFAVVILMDIRMSLQELVECADSRPYPFDNQVPEKIFVLFSDVIDLGGVTR